MDGGWKQNAESSRGEANTWIHKSFVSVKPSTRDRCGLPIS